MMAFRGGVLMRRPTAQWRGGNWPSTLAKLNTHSTWVVADNSWSSRPSEARAGTHNHRWIDLRRGWGGHAVRNYSALWLWVPAFAGTTRWRL